MTEPAEDIRQYDCVVIGAGQAGVPLATSFAAAGRRTALVERLHVGGTCVNEGCTPTKTMVACAEVAYLSRRANDYGIHAGYVRAMMDKVRQRKRDIVESFMTSSQTALLGANNLDLIFGHAHFSGPKSLEVLQIDGEVQSLSAETIVIDAGCRPLMPTIPGIDRIDALNSTTIMELDELPEHLIVLGGGYVGVEFGQMFRRFGSRVTIVQSAPYLLPHEDKDVSRNVAEILRRDGVRVLLASDAAQFEKGSSSIRVTINSQGMEMPIEGTHVLVAVGRTPNCDGLDLAAAGVEIGEDGYIAVDERLQTSAPGIYAVGDIKGGPQFTHISYDDYRILRSNLIDGGNSSTAGRMVPYTVFMDPQLGRIGIGEDEARAKGMEIKVARLQMTSVARALETDRSLGFMKVIVDPSSERLLGFCCLGQNGGEVMAMAQVAMMGNLKYTALRDGIFAHPTLAESFNNLFAALE